MVEDMIETMIVEMIEVVGGPTVIEDTIEVDVMGGVIDGPEAAVLGKSLCYL